MAEIRLQKVLAESGVASRRNCEELILDGRVKVNGEVVDKLPVFVDPENDKITVDGKQLRAEQKVYYLLNKPKGVICTNSDPYGRKKAIDLIKAKERIFCVGRLDADSTGLIILTNDSQLTNKLTHPKYKVAKTYVAQVKGAIEPAKIEKLKKGIWLAEGRTNRSAIKILKKARMETLLEITITQGLNRQVRRMLAKVGLPVKSLKRTRIGKLNIRGLGPGSFRHLTGAELKYLGSVTGEKSS
ncbi:MAG: rRNA pseudouridine synthase [Phycisphaerae bacterium]|nr:rRNA pseudouridine synthase [Phycisphaerae bacterium]